MTTHRILCLLRAHERRTPVHPRACFWKECIQELTNKHDWNNQCFPIPRTLSPKHRNRDVLETRAVQPASPGHCPFHSQQVTTGNTQRKAVLEGESSGALYLEQYQHTQLAFSYIPKSLHKKGCWLDELSSNSCASHTFDIL